MEYRWSQLADYPSLEDWFRTMAKKTLSLDHPADKFIMSIDKLLRSESEHRLSVWFQEVNQFIDNSSNIYADLIRIEQVLADHSFDLMGFVSELGELAVINDKGRAFYSCIGMLADQSGLAAFRFLAAWTALNTGQLQECVAECEKVEQPIACIYTIQGQAMLELGMAEEAVDCLHAATKLSSSETLAFFQLAKAYHALSDYKSAWKALVDCEALTGQNIEVATFFGLIALCEPTEDRLKYCWDRLSPYLSNEGEQSELVFMLMDLSFTAEIPEWFSNIVDRVDWEQTKKNPAFFNKLPWILSKLDGLHWSQENIVFLDKVAQVEKSG